MADAYRSKRVSDFVEKKALNTVEKHIKIILTAKVNIDEYLTRILSML